MHQLGRALIDFAEMSLTEGLKLKFVEIKA